MATKAKTKTLTERFAMNPGVVVNREAGTISGVRICGGTSANGRSYPKAVFKESKALYEGVASHLGHDKRSFESLIATVTEVANDAEGFPRCTLRVDKSDPYAEKLLNTAQHAPEKVGLSHVAECKTRFEAGVEVIEQIVKVESVDVVIDPATNPKGFAESKESPMKRIKFALFLEAIAPKLKLAKLLNAKRLAEMDGVGDMEVSEPVADAGGDGSLADALQELVASISKEFTDGNLSADDAGAKVTAFFKAHAGETEKPAEDPAAAEAKRAAAAKSLTTEIINFKAEGLKEIKAELAALKNALAELRAEKPKSGPKVEPKKESTGGDPKPLPTDDRDVIALLKSA